MVLYELFLIEVSSNVTEIVYYFRLKRSLVFFSVTVLRLANVIITVYFGIMFRLDFFVG